MTMSKDTGSDPAASLGSVTKHDGSPEPTAHLPNTVHAGCRSRESDAGTGDIVERLRRWGDAVDAVSYSDLIDEAANEIDRLRAKIDRLHLVIIRIAAEDATLSVCDRNVTVTMAGTLTEAERDAVWTVAEAYAGNDDDPECERLARVLQGIYQRLK
jgi:hypothetical protein